MLFRESILVNYLTSIFDDVIMTSFRIYGSILFLNIHFFLFWRVPEFAILFVNI